MPKKEKPKSLYKDRLRVDILSLFPDYFQGPFDVSLIKKAKENKLLEINCIDIRSFAKDKHNSVDDRPYGGGPGMVMMPGPVVDAIRSVKTEDAHRVLLSPQGKQLNAKKARELSECSHLILVCGHYEGIDERVIDLEIDEEISIGDYVLTSGCAAAVVLLEAVSRFVPGVLGHSESAELDSFESGGFDAPHYTRPLEFEGLKVPEVLTSGNHREIEKYRHKRAYEKTKRVRPDLIEETNGSSSHN